MRSRSTSTKRPTPPFKVTGERLRAAHAPEAGGEHEAAGQRAAEVLPRAGAERLVGALQDPLGADVDPGAGRHLAIHRQPHRFVSPEMLPVAPLGHEQRVGDEDARRVRVRPEHADRFPGLDEQGLVGAERRSVRTIVWYASQFLAAFRIRRRRPGPPTRSATSGSRLFMSIRSAASCGQPLQESSVPRGARTGAEGRSVSEVIKRHSIGRRRPVQWRRVVMAILNALIAALAFGLSAPLAKRLLDTVPPLFLAGILYLGAGIFLGLVRRFWRRRPATGRPLTARDRGILAGVVLVGGVLAPPLLLWGLQRSSATTTGPPAQSRGRLHGLAGRDRLQRAPGLADRPRGRRRWPPGASCWAGRRVIRRSRPAPPRSPGRASSGRSTTT